MRLVATDVSLPAIGHIGLKEFLHDRVENLIRSRRPLTWIIQVIRPEIFTDSIDFNEIDEPTLFNLRPQTFNSTPGFLKANWCGRVGIKILNWFSLFNLAYKMSMAWGESFMSRISNSTWSSLGSSNWTFMM